MTDETYWLLFFTAALAINLSPGPDLFYIVGQTLSGGKRVGLASVAGVCSGALAHVVAVALGLSVLVATSELAFNAIRYLGAGYLAYLAVKSFRSAATAPPRATGRSGPPGSWQAFRQGFLVDVLNPKVALFFMAFLPQFVRPGHGSEASQMLFLGSLVICVAVVVEVMIVIGVSRAGTLIFSRPGVSRWLHRVFGGVLVALAARLVLMEPK